MNENEHFDVNIKSFEKIFKFSTYVIAHQILVAVKGVLANLMILKEQFGKVVCKCYLGFVCYAPVERFCVIK